MDLQDYADYVYYISPDPQPKVNGKWYLVDSKAASPSLFLGKVPGGRKGKTPLVSLYLQTFKANFYFFPLTSER